MNKVTGKPKSNTKGSSTFGTSAYGGAGWVQREKPHGDELGGIWARHKIDSEWRPLQAVIVHQPGEELAASLEDPESVLMLEPLNLTRAREQHAAMVEAYEKLGVEVHHVMPEGDAPPNQMFCADLFVMTPQGAILARPAGQVRAGEERWAARRLADLGTPILKTLTGDATFEGADLMWLDEQTAMIGRGHRTNQAAIDQITAVLAEIGCETLAVDMPYGTMHFMGMLRIADSDLAICWPRRTPLATVKAVVERGYEVIFPPYEDDAESYRAMNFVTLGPRKIMMAAGLAKFQPFFEQHGIDCVTVATDELSKAAGNIGCLTGVLGRVTK
ncbi:dimethylarginine dimethylaminohydrolase family protein [Dongia soli]|uniref:arginine deiminase n=1 Tax=Dongia soli TaxID=600628 RepID=A0ABU5EGC5_9PROT|nr:arginine deiminase family protein [Dongia soli]MDY0885263.1 arginine deiminase family protein [Dongia soli]